MNTDNMTMTQLNIDWDANCIAVLSRQNIEIF